MIPRRLIVVASLLAGCSAAVEVSTGPRPTEAEDRAAIEAVSAARARAFNESDAAGIAVHFTEDGLLMPPESDVLRGREAVQSYYRKIFDDYEPALESGYLEVEVSGDLAFGRGFARVRLTPKSGGEATESTAKYINILKRQADGSWKTTHDVWNSNGAEER